MRRARETWANPSPDADIVAALADVIEVGWLLAEFLDAAVDYGTGDRFPELRGLAAEHRRLAGELASRVRDMGATPPVAVAADPRRLPVAAADLDYLQSESAVIDALERDLEALAVARSRALEIVVDGEVAELLSAVNEIK